MDPIDLLEQRIAALELQVLPQDTNLDVNKSQLITDLLLQTHTMIATALSCREVITTILQRMEVVNEYLNPSYCENKMEVEHKRQYVLELYPELKKTVLLVTEFEKLKCFIDSPAINNIPTLTNKLEQLTITNLEIYDECREVTDKILNSLQQYKDITGSIKLLFLQLEQAISSIELSLETGSQ